MKEKKEPYDSNRTPDDGKTLDRRRFLFGVGAISVGASLLPNEKLEAASAPESNAEAHNTVPSEFPHFGGLFNTYHRPEDWSVLARQQPEGMPLLGAYASNAVGSISTQIIWAKSMGMGFFLASYSPHRPTDGLDALFATAAQTDFEIAVYIDLDDPSPGPSSSRRERLQSAVSTLRTRYLKHPAYLRDGDGRPIVALIGGRDDEDAAKLSSATVWRLAPAWRKSAADVAAPDLGEATERGLYLGYSNRSEMHPAARVMPSSSARSSAVLVSAQRDAIEGIKLPPTHSAGKRPAYVIVDSFNHWLVSVPLEPGTASHNHYSERIRDWLREQAA